MPRPRLRDLGITIGTLPTGPLNAITDARPLAVKQRTLVAEGDHGSIAIFPAPHQYFYPLDFAENFKFAWFGRGYGKLPAGFVFGIRQPPDGDKRWVPWFDAPANKEHHLAIFYLLSSGDGEQALQEVARYTHGDRFAELPGYRTFTSHYHVEHTQDFLDRQKNQQITGIPNGLETPGFITKFKDTGVDPAKVGGPIDGASGWLERRGVCGHRGQVHSALTPAVEITRDHLAISSCSASQRARSAGAGTKTVGFVSQTLPSIAGIVLLRKNAASE